MAYVYKHIRRDNKEPFYIGVGGLISFDNYQRALAKNKKGLKARSEFWYNYRNLYGFEVEIILDNCTVQEAFSKEIELIKLYGRQDIGTGILVNHTDGGEGAFGFSEETRRKCGAKNIGKIISKETRAKLIAYQSTRPPRSEKTRVKTSNSHKNKKKSDIHLIKIIQASPFQKGFIPWNKGLKYKREGVILNIENGIYYDTIEEAANSINMKKSILQDMLRKKTINRTNLIKLEK